MAISAEQVQQGLVPGLAELTQSLINAGARVSDARIKADSANRLLSLKSAAAQAQAQEQAQGDRIDVQEDIESSVQDLAFTPTGKNITQTVDGLRFDTQRLDVNSVAPGVADTARAKGFLADNPETKEVETDFVADRQGLNTLQNIHDLETRVGQLPPGDRRESLLRDANMLQQLMSDEHVQMDQVAAGASGLRQDLAFALNPSLGDRAVGGGNEDLFTPSVGAETVQQLWEQSEEGKTARYLQGSSEDRANVVAEMTGRPPHLVSDKVDTTRVRDIHDQAFTQAIAAAGVGPDMVRSIQADMELNRAQGVPPGMFIASEHGDRSASQYRATALAGSMGLPIDAAHSRIVNARQDMLPLASSVSSGAKDHIFEMASMLRAAIPGSLTAEQKKGVWELATKAINPSVSEKDVAADMRRLFDVRETRPTSPGASRVSSFGISVGGRSGAKRQKQSIDRELGVRVAFADLMNMMGSK